MMIRSLRKVDFSHPTAHFIRKNIAPLENILGAPLGKVIAFAHVIKRTKEQKLLKKVTHPISSVRLLGGLASL